MINFEEAVSADIHQLHSMLAQLAPVPDPLYIYLAARTHYLTGDLDSLRTLIESDLTSATAAPWLKSLMEFRLHIRLKTPHPCEAARIKDLRENTEVSADVGWSAEIEMVLGMYFEELERFNESASAYRDSARLFEQAKCREKSLTAEYNALIAQTRAEPQRRYVVAFQSFVRRAEDAGHTTLAGVALANLAREYQLLGLLELALAKAQAAIDLLSKKSFGALHYFLAIAQALDLMIATRKTALARQYYEELLGSPYHEIEEIVKVLEKYCPGSEFEPTLIDTQILPQPWNERLTANAVLSEKDEVSDLESQILSQLLEKPLSLSDLSVHLYGEKIGYESALARTKQAIYRLRKKKPGLIRFKKGQYEIAD